VIESNPPSGPVVVATVAEVGEPVWSFTSLLDCVRYVADRRAAGVEAGDLVVDLLAPRPAPSGWCAELRARARSRQCFAPPAPSHSGEWPRPAARPPNRDVQSIAADRDRPASVILARRNRAATPPASPPKPGGWIGADRGEAWRAAGRAAGSVAGCGGGGIGAEPAPGSLGREGGSAAMPGGSSRAAGREGGAVAAGRAAAGGAAAAARKIEAVKVGVASPGEL